MIISWRRKYSWKILQVCSKINFATVCQAYELMRENNENISFNG